jgi:hypothetical protein
VPSPEAAASAPERAPGALEPCALLSAEEVSTVLPGHDGGFVAKDGGSLVDGINTYTLKSRSE